MRIAERGLALPWFDSRKFNYYSDNAKMLSHRQIPEAGGAWRKSSAAVIYAGRGASGNSHRACGDLELMRESCFGREFENQGKEYL
jgi:hypothetical protein